MKISDTPRFLKQQPHFTNNSLFIGKTWTHRSFWENQENPSTTFIKEGEGSHNERQLLFLAFYSFHERNKV